jgi:small multidrug resistance pump
MKKETIRILSRLILTLAAIYNIFWGIWILIDPTVILFDDTNSIFVTIVLQCVGMLVGVYGIAYYFASLDPARYWPLILVGLIGKVLGPIGALNYIFSGQLDPHFFWVNVFNDVIWIFPFSWILYHVYKKNLPYGEEDDDEDEGDI